MKNYIKSYLITIFINDILIAGFILYSYSNILLFDYKVIIGKFLVYILLSVLKNTLRLLALMFIIVLPLYRLIMKYPDSTLGITFCAGFPVFMVIYITGWLFAGNLGIISLFMSVGKALILGSIFTALYWWFNRVQRRSTKNIIEDFS